MSLSGFRTGRLRNKTALPDSDSLEDSFRRFNSVFTPQTLPPQVTPRSLHRVSDRHTGTEVTWGAHDLESYLLPKLSTELMHGRTDLVHEVSVSLYGEF